MKLSKINIMEGEWSDDHYYKSLLPLIQNADIPTVRLDMLPVTRLYDSTYWGNLRSIHRTDIAVLDSRQWYLSDQEFYDYVHEVSKINFDAVVLFEHPYGGESPRSVDIDSLERKLFERTKIAVAAIRGRKGSKVQIISPAISDVPSEFYDRYVDYFLHHRNVFDIYSLHIANDMQEATIGRVTSMLTQVLKALPREVWVTKWAIPSVNKPISTAGIVGESNWKQISYASAVQRLRHIFISVESITGGKSKWFYTGMCQDKYKPRHLPSPMDFWRDPTLMTSSHAWGHQHFFGIIDHKGEIKEEVFDGFMTLADQQNK